MLIEKMISIAGTADGRPCYVIQNASARATISIVAVRADAKTTTAILNPNWPCAERRTSDARPYGWVIKNQFVI